MLDTAVRGRISRRRQAIRPERETIAPRLLSAPAAQHSQVIVVAVVLHHQNQNVVDLGKTVRAFWLVREGPLTLDPSRSTTRLRSQNARLPVLDPAHSRPKAAVT